MKIVSIRASEILDSRGNPTVAAITTLEDGSEGWAAVPSGASTGSYEAVELRDGDAKRYNGMGTLKAVANVNDKIFPALAGKNAEDQREIDRLMLTLDGTPNKSSLGANAILSVSLSVARAQAGAEKKPLYAYLSKFNPDFAGTYYLPMPQLNVMNGGKHANWTTDIQEYMVIPVGARTMSKAVEMGAEVYAALREYLALQGYNVNIGDEGGFAPVVASNEVPFQLMTEAIRQAGYEVGTDLAFGIDPAASEFFRDGKYVLSKEDKTLTSEELKAWYMTLMGKYPLVNMEDIFAEDDWSTFTAFTKGAGTKTQIVGDDLYATNVKLLQKGIDTKATNAILVKVNQIGSLTETIDAILLARKNKLAVVVSHRSGETEDTFIADFVVAMGTGQIKTGAPARSERTAKYNRLLTIEQELGENAKFADFGRENLFSIAAQ